VWRLVEALPGMPAISRRLDTPLVGRTAELSKLREAFATAVEVRETVLFALLGAAGMGKSRLVSEFTEIVGAEARVVVGRCLPYGEGITYWPVNEALADIGGAEAMAELLADEPDGELVLTRLAALSGSAPAAAGQEMFWAIRRVFETLARDQPLVVCLEDLHWAEPTLLDLVEYLAAWVQGVPMLLLCLARPDLLDTRPSLLGSSLRAVSLALEPLPADAAEAMLESLEVAVDRDRIIRVAEGNPLYVEQLAAAIAEGGRADAIPPTLQALLAARLDLLGAGERNAIECAAVAGRQFWRDAVAYLTAEDEMRLRIGTDLLALVRKDLIRPVPSRARPDDAFRFGHALIRDAAYGAIAKERRARLHERFAEWLGMNAGGRLTELQEIVGYHLEQAYRYYEQLGPIGDAAEELGIRAGELLGDAGRRAFARGDMPAAVNLLARSTALLPPTHSRRTQTLADLGSALMRAGDFGKAESALTEAVERAAAAGDKQLELRAIIDREFLRVLTNPADSTDDIVHVAEAAIPVLEELGDDLGLAKAWWLRSEAEVNAGHWGERAAALERALEHSRRASDSRDESTLTALLAQALLYGPTPVPEAIERCEQLRLVTTGGETAGDEGSPDRQLDRAVEAAVATSLAELRAMQGEFEQARSLCARAQEIYDELGLRYMRAVRCVTNAAVELLAGDAAAAASELRAGYDALESMGERGVRATVAAFLAHTLSLQGAYEEAERFAAISEEAAAAADVVTQAMLRAARAVATVRSGDAARAEKLAREAVELAESTDFLDFEATMLLALADVVHVAGRNDEAGELVERARATCERKGNVVGVRNAEAWLGRLREATPQPAR
jgi:tetratricopeptide (TPR) repeat protein